MSRETVQPGLRLLSVWLAAQPDVQQRRPQAQRPAIQRARSLIPPIHWHGSCCSDPRLLPPRKTLVLATATPLPIRYTGCSVEYAPRNKNDRRAGTNLSKIAHKMEMQHYSARQNEGA